MKKLNSAVSSLMSILVASASSATGEKKGILTGIAQNLTGGMKKLKKFNQGQGSAPVSTNATSTVPVDHVKTAKAFQADLQKKFAKNGNQPIVVSLKTGGQFKSLRPLTLAAATQHLTMVLGINGTLAQAIIAPKGVTIPKKMFQKGFTYASAIQNGQVQGVSHKVMTSKIGKKVAAAIKPVKGLKLQAFNAQS